MKFMLALLLLLISVLTATANDHCVLLTDYTINIRAGSVLRGVVRTYIDGTGSYNNDISPRSFGAIYWTKDYAEVAAPLYFQLLKRSGPVFRSTNLSEHTITTSLIPVGQTKPEEWVVPQCYPSHATVTRSEYSTAVWVSHYQIWFAWNAEISVDSPGVLRFFTWPGGPLDYSLEFYFYNRNRYVGSAELKFEDLKSTLPAYMELLTGDAKLYTSYGSLYTRTQ